MATQVQLRRGNTTQTNAFTGALAEITVDTDKNTVVVHDGSTLGGTPLAKEGNLTAIFAQANAAFDLANGTAGVANTDVTNIAITDGTYGNSTHVPVITLSANGRVNAVSTVAITASDPNTLAFAIALG